MTIIVYRNERLQFLPSYERIKDFIISIYEMIEEIPLNLLRIEHQIYENFHTTKFLEVRISVRLH